MIRTPSWQSQPKILARTAAASSEHSLPTRGRAHPEAHGRDPRIWPRRIGLFGLFGSGNSGNDGSLEAMLNFLRRVRPDAELVCFCSARTGAIAHVGRDFGIGAIPFGLQKPANPLLRLLDRLTAKIPRLLASWIGAVTHARHLDVLIVPGTGILDDFGEAPSGMPATLFGWCLAAKLCGTRVAFVSIGAGPIYHPVSRWLMKSAIAMAEYRSYRDTVSKAFLDGIGFDTRADAVYPDLAFELALPPSFDTKGSTAGPLTVGVGVMTYLGWRNDRARGDRTYAAYIAKITDFAIWILDRGHRVRVLMGDATDRRAADDLSRNIAAARPDLLPNRVVADPVRSLHDLMRQIAKTDVVVATRFHNVVCALKLGKPTVSIGYAEKNDALMAEMGLGRFCQHIERLNLDLLIEQFTQLIAGCQRYEQRIRDANLAYRERLDRQNSALESRLLNP